MLTMLSLENAGYDMHDCEAMAHPFSCVENHLVGCVHVLYDVRT
jgi:hypothetical protein